MKFYILPVSKCICFLLTIEIIFGFNPVLL